MATRACPHGFDPPACLICATLNRDQPATALAAAGAPHRDQTTDRHGRPVEVAGGRSPVRFRPGVLGWLVVVVAVLTAGWFALGFVVAALHVLELVAVGLGCGWVGYRVGVRSGRRHPR